MSWTKKFTVVDQLLQLLIQGLEDMEIALLLYCSVVLFRQFYYQHDKEKCKIRLI